MQTITLKTESYLFEGLNGEFRAIPFYELSIHEFVIFENGVPKFFIDFNFMSPIVLDITSKVKNGASFEEVIQDLGAYKGRQWTFQHNIQGEEVPNSEQAEIITLFLLKSINDNFENC